MSKKRIMLFTDWYEPGFKAGGPIKSCMNFVAQMKDGYEIFIFTSDRDLDEKLPYPLITANKWIASSETVQIFYAAPEALTFNRIKKEVSKINPDFLYLNSMFSFRFSLLPILAVWPKRNTKIILAPRGMLKRSALQFKALKKKVFLSLFKLAGFPSRITFHATDEAEVSEIQHQFGNKPEVFFIQNFSAVVHKMPSPLVKSPGNILIAFVGRIHPVKNLLYLIENLLGVKGNITVNIAGNIEDQNYFKLCMQKAQLLNESVKVKYNGSLPSSEVEAFLIEHHILALPTVGENFGHAIFESLSLGRPVVISNNTPWKKLEDSKAGYDISLDEPGAFSEAIQRFVDMDNEEYACWSTSAWKFVSTKNNNQQLKRNYFQLFS